MGVDVEHERNGGEPSIARVGIESTMGSSHLQTPLLWFEVREETHMIAILLNNSVVIPPGRC